MAFFTRHHQRIDALRLRDIRGAQQVPLGQRELDFAGLAAVIPKTGWPGWLAVQEENLPKSTDTPAIESVLEADRRDPQVLWRVTDKLSGGEEFTARST